MRIDLDTYREILDTLTRNKERKASAELCGFCHQQRPGVGTAYEQGVQGFPQGAQLAYGLQGCRPFAS